MKHLIFDFDGTIVDSGPLIYNNLVEYTNNKTFTWEELRGLSSKDVLKTLKISKFELPYLIMKIRRDFKLKLSQQPIVLGMADVLMNLKQRGYVIHIVSSNSKENIAEFLLQNQLHGVVTDVMGFFTIFGKSRGIEKLINKLQCSRANTIYIGDETRDIEAAKKVNIRSLAVTWGYNTEEVLATYKPDDIARKPEDLLMLN